MSIYQLPLTWRGRTAAGIPYKVLDRTGDAERNAEQVVETILIPAILLQHFLAESFPPVQIINNMPVWENRPCPGAPQLKTRRVSWKPHMPGLPADPFLVDPIGILAGSYGLVLEVTVEYSNLEREAVLEIRANAGIQVLHITAPKGKWVDTTAELQQNRSATMPASVIVPETQWTATWSGVPRKWFTDVLVPRMRRCVGKVNESTVWQLYDAPTETILFVGYSTTHAWTRASGTDLPPPDDLEGVVDPENNLDLIVDEEEQPLINVEMQFLEKHHTEDDGTIRGHNDYWLPEEGGWRYLLVDGQHAVFRKADLNILFEMNTG